MEASTLEQGRADPQLQVVHRPPRALRQPIRRIAPRALEAGRAGAAQARFLAPQTGVFTIKQTTHLRCVVCFIVFRYSNRGCVATNKCATLARKLLTFYGCTHQKGEDNEPE